MWDTEPELLVVVDQPDRPDRSGQPDRAGAAPRPGADPLVALAGLGTVTSALAPRLALLAVPASRAPQVAALPGVRGVFVDEVPPALRETFTAAECLFVDAWIARGVAKHRDPPGGEPWDLPGRRPPDPPDAFDPDLADPTVPPDLG